ncbi:hypothetical protein [Streptomyces sp. BV129]|uniref:hypothetical protein n=1 Tax=Streptomyces sp. BV129 TaxID=2849671 RepID=UPI001C2E6401|nr:hypothetical protein [Streptomyces sp. BV129]MBV1948907.1 hypothetical protein [Streptomyces sp. BV129]
MRRELRILSRTALVVCALLGTGPAAVAGAERTQAAGRPIVVVGTPLQEMLPTDSGRAEGVWVSNVERGDLTDVSVSIDASALAAVSDDVDVPCDPDGDLVGECHGIGPVRTGVPVKVGDVRIGRPKAAAVGIYQLVRMAATAQGGPVDTNRFVVSVRETGPEFDRGAPKRVRLAPGATLTLPGGFTNYSSHSLDAVGVMLSLSSGLSLGERFRNCVWQPADEAGKTEVLCTVKGPFAARTSYDLDFGPLRADVHAMYEAITYQARSVTAELPLVSFLVEGAEQGDGPNELRAVARTGATTSLRTNFTQGPLSSTVDVTNTADFAVSGATLRGRTGDVVPVEFTVRNLGPGARAATDKEENGTRSFRALWFSVPPGASVVKAPPGCVGYSNGVPPKYTEGFLGLGKPGGRGYGCGPLKSSRFTVGRTDRFRFEVRMDEPGRSSAGYVTTMYRAGDPRPENNKAPVSVEIR